MALDIFKKVAKTAAKKPKAASMPEFSIPEADLALNKAIQRWFSAKKLETEAKADIKRSEAVFLDKIIEEHRKTCQSTDTYYSSIRTLLESDESRDSKLVVSFTNKYSDIDPQHEPELRRIYGKKLFDRYFEEKTEATLTPQAMKDESFISTIVESIGEENFAKYFKVKQVLKPKPSYHEARMIDEELAEKHQEAQDAHLVNPNKPSVKKG